MIDGTERDDDELEMRQGGRLYPVGRSLRSTFPAPDGADLQPRITTLMVELAHQPYERGECGSGVAPHAPSLPAEPSSPSLLRRLGSFFRND